MVRADSHGITRVPWYSRLYYCFTYFFVYEAVTLFGCPFQSNSTKIIKPILKTVFFRLYNLTTPISQHIQIITQYRFRLFPIRSPLQRESLRFLFLALLRCFSSRSSPFYLMYSDKNTLSLPKVGFPIRKSSDLSLIDSSPKLMAAFHLLQRLSMPKASTKCPFQLTTNLLVTQTLSTH